MRREAGEHCRYGARAAGRMDDGPAIEFLAHLVSLTVMLPTCIYVNCRQILGESLFYLSKERIKKMSNTIQAG
jgi:hypothetical protein